MFDISFGELVVVGVVAMWAVGPKKLPAVARVLGRYLNRFRQTFSSVKNDFMQEFADDRKSDDEKRS